MNRLMIIILCFLGLSSVIKADEQEDSLKYYVQRYYMANQAGDIQDACNCLKHTLRLYKELRKDVSLDTVYASFGNTYADLCFQIGDYNEAIRLETEVVEIRKKSVGADHQDYAAALNKLAGYYASLGNYNEAIRLGTESVEVTKRVLGTEHPNYALSLINLAWYYSSLGNYNEAIRLGTKAVEITKRTLGIEHPYYTISLDLLAGHYSSLCNYNEAIRLETEVVEIRKKSVGADHQDYAAALNKLAGYYASLGNYNEAIRLGTEVVGIRKRVLGTEHPYYASSLINLAWYYSELGNYNEAIRLGSEAVEITKRVLGTEHPKYADFLNSLAVYRSKLGEYNEAIRLGSEAMEIMKRVLGAEHPNYARSLHDLALDYYYLGNYNEALRLLSEAKRIKEKVFGTNHPQYAVSLNNLAYIYYEMGDYDNAFKLGMEVMNIFKKAVGKEHPYYAESLYSLLHFIGLGKHNEALPFLKEYSEIVRKNVLCAFSGMSTNERTFLWDKYNVKYNLEIPCILVESGITEASSLLYNNNALFAKGLLLSTELEMTKLIQESGDDEALQMYLDLRKNRQILNVQYSKPIAERYIDCDSLERVSNDLERQLVSRVKAFGDYTRNLSITWRDIQSKLNDNDVAIEFLSYPEKDGEINYVALTLCKNDTAPILTPLFVESKLLETSGYHETYQTLEADSLVWGSLSSRIEGKAHVYFSASGMLHNIGIEYLPSMEGKNCYRLSSTRELVTHTPNETLRSATLYGDIDYDATYAAIESKTPSAIKYYAMNLTKQNRGVFDDRSLDDGVDALPGTRAELNEVSKLMQSRGMLCDTVTGVLASEESFKALSGQRKSLLHISTHGFYYNDKKANNLKSHLRQMLMGDDRPAYAEDQSLLRCGLCFAGANQALQGKSQPSEWQGDGVLNALEIAQTDLRGLDLVVLSACQTALGDIAQGEGVFGLQRGFKKAGAKTLLMSLWKVNDVATKILMVEFYKNYLAGKSKLESLRKAQQYVRDYTDEKGEKLFDDPHYWAGFILLDALD